MVARAGWIENLIDLKIVVRRRPSGRGAGPEVAERGEYRKHMEGLRQRLSRAMVHVTARLKAIGIVPWLEPHAGMILWGRLPDGIDAAEITRAALAKNVVLAPGNVFSLSQSATGFMRFNVSQTLDERIFDVLREILSPARQQRQST